MKKLLITANPSSHWFTHTIAHELEKLSKEKWDEVEILDLYTTDLKQDFLRYENKKDMAQDKITKAMQDKILWADELVFIYPTRWWDVPAIMKNFLDCNFAAWFAFKYENGKAVWLLTGRTGRVITTTWWPWFLYKLLFHIQIFWNLNRIWYWGMKQKSFTVFGDMDRSKTDKTAYLPKLKNLV